MKSSNVDQLASSSIRRFIRRRPVALAVGALVAAGLIAVPGIAHADTACGVVYERVWDNGSGFGAKITIRNLGSPLAGWTLTYAWPGNQHVDHGWSATWSQVGANVTATSMSWNANLGTGASTEIGFNGSYSGTNPAPTSFSVNGTVCAGPTPTPQVVVTPTLISVPEGGSTTIAVRLTAAPTANLTVPVIPGPGDPDLTICSGAALTFTPANWNSVQTVRFCAAEDADTVNGTRTFTLGVPGGTTNTVTATEADNDVPTVSKVDNPFAGASGYVNPDWQALVNAEAASQPSPVSTQMRAVGQQPTAVWLDRIAAITAGRGLTGHLEAALAQDAANGTDPVVVSLVLYDLPNRNCPAPASELSVAGNGLNRYRAEYIDPIRAILAQPRFANLRVAVIVEPGSLHTLVTHHSGLAQSTLRCIEAHASGVYRDGIRYAVGQLGTLPNTYLYLDIANSGWLGWDVNLATAVNVYDQTIAATAGGPGYDKIHGFVTNTADYVPVEEIFLPDPLHAVNGSPIWMSRFYDFNKRFDERDYATDLRAAFVSRGCTGCGMLIDTSRNGWGGAVRPTTVSTSNQLDLYVGESRLDRRPHRSGWCNQNGAGLGPRPTADTGIAGVDAFVWVKPPGESDGVSQPNILDEDDPFKTFDPMCDPLRDNRYEDEVRTNAMPNAPHFGRWFPQQFATLVRNAFPAL